MNKKIFMMIEDLHNSNTKRINYMAEQEQLRLEILERILELPEEDFETLLRLIADEQ